MKVIVSSGLFIALFLVTVLFGLGMMIVGLGEWIGNLFIKET